MEVQPFFYKEQGFDDVLEVGIQGYQDDGYYVASVHQELIITENSRCGIAAPRRLEFM